MKKMTMMVAVMMAVVLVGCSSGGSASGGAAEIKMGQAKYAAHGTKSFAVATVAMNGDKIASAYMDEFQVMDKTNEPVPNNDTIFADYLPEDMALVSKRVNDAAYSAMMKEIAGATQSISGSYQAIEAYVKGKTIAELEADIKDKDSAAVVDAVSGSTLVDTRGYIEAFIEAAKNAQ